MEITVVFTEQLYVKNVLLQKQIVARIIPNVVSESSGGCLYTHVEKYVNNNTWNISLSQKKKTHMQKQYVKPWIHPYRFHKN